MLFFSNILFFVFFLAKKIICVEQLHLLCVLSWMELLQKLLIAEKNRRDCQIYWHFVCYWGATFYPPAKPICIQLEVESTWTERKRSQSTLNSFELCFFKFIWPKTDGLVWLTHSLLWLRLDWCGSCWWRSQHESSDGSMHVFLHNGWLYSLQAFVKNN